MTKSQMLASAHTKHVLWTKSRERERKKKCGRQKDSLERNWYWKDFFSCARRRSDNESWFRVVAVSVKILHMCATICGFQTDSISFFFSSYLILLSAASTSSSYDEVGRRRKRQQNPLKTFIQINAHTLNIRRARMQLFIIWKEICLLTTTEDKMKKDWEKSQRERERHMNKPV